MDSHNSINKIISSIVEEIDNNIDLFHDASVENGKMGLAIFYAFCNQYYKDSKYIQKMEDMIEDSVNLLSEVSTQKLFIPKFHGDSLANVISSFGKGLLFLENKFNFNYRFTEYYKVISDILIDLTRRSIKENDYDFFSGALSGGHFFLNSYHYNKDDVSKKILTEIGLAIKNAAIALNDKEVYWTAPAYRNSVYLGLSHGSAMVINFITKLFELSLFDREDLSAFTLLKKATAFLLNRNTNFVDGYFPHVFLKEQYRAQKTQFALCYGDLGILFALYNANKILKDPAIEKEVSFMLNTSSQRKADSTFTYDSGILYGAGGIYHVFNELYDRSGYSSYKSTANYWYDQILNYRDPAQTGNAGFIDIFGNSEKSINPSGNHSFGWGLAGIGISLMSSPDSDMPKINELLLIGI